jgi:hypothetical protein
MSTRIDQARKPKLIPAHRELHRRIREREAMGKVYELHGRSAACIEHERLMARLGVK